MNRGVRRSVEAAAVVLFALLIAGCEGDRGPAGPAGTTECFGCHSDNFQMANFLLPEKMDYEQSLHALGDTFRRRGAPCSRCHTNEGLQSYLAMGVEVDLTESSKIHCFTCHAPHENFSFAVRQQEPTPFFVDGVETAPGSYDFGSSNMCAVCHQARPAIPPIADGAVVESFRWGPHHSPQANAVVGNTAHVFPGATYATGPGHKLVEKGCVTCHMSVAPSNQIGGGHTMEIRYGSGGTINAAGCIACHDDWVDDNAAATAAVDELQAEIFAELAAVQAELFARGFISTADPAEIPRTTTGTYDSANDLGAIYNLLLLKEDGSLGVHNPAYARSVLAATKEYLGIP